MHQIFECRYSSSCDVVDVYRATDDVMLGSIDLSNGELLRTNSCTDEEFDSFWMLRETAYELQNTDDRSFTFEVDI